MDDVLLATKLHIPPRPHRGVSRARLVDALEGDIAHHKLVLLAAPAGYGKTTLLSQWAPASRFPVAWFAVGEEDNDLERFLRYLLAGWERVQPGIAESPLGAFLDAMAPDNEAVLVAFINAANEIPAPIVFVLDDYHLIQDPAIHTALTFLLDHLPPGLHFVLAGRSQPPLPLARYRARHELAEFRAKDLCFSPGETQVFLTETMGLDLAEGEITRLQAQLEGWIAGLQLVALAHQQGLTGADHPTATGRHRFIADYLSEDVLVSVPEHLRRFLLQTSILERLSGALCEAITGEAGGQEMLERLERENLFLVPLDDRREWFRYHHLFADFLREELGRRRPGELGELHRRAARWYLDHDLPEPAFRHALEGEDLECVARVVERYVPMKLLTGEVRVVKGWLDSIPEAWHAGQPTLGLAQAFFLAFIGAFQDCVHCLDGIEQRLAPVESEEAAWQLARVTACRSLIACLQNDMPRAEGYAERALQDLRQDDVFFRAGIHHSLGDLYRQNGRWTEARANYYRVLEFAEHPSGRFRRAHIYGALADLDLRQGHLQGAAALWRQALATIREPESRGRVPLPVVGWVYIRMGEILYEWNELAEARDHLSRGLERAELGGDTRAMIAGFLIAGRQKLTEGAVEEAVEYLERARPLVDSAGFSHWRSRFERFQLELWLAQDRLRAAVQWADDMLADDALERRPESEVAQLAMARVLIVKGDGPSVERALALLDRLLQVAEREGRMGVTVEGRALQALAHWRRGERAAAVAALERALRQAEPEGYVRRFADLGLPMARLLQEARARDVMPGYVETLLAAFGGDVALPAPSLDVLPEPLTPREREILELLAAGLTNREIAQALVISPGTVKKHAGNIYGKLGVHSRTEAAARGRDLDLLA